jgi:uncharacterized repeat protein (TIGR03943 family)
VNRSAQAFLLLLLGGSVVKVSATDVYLRYVKEGLRPFLIAAGLLLIAAAVVTFFHDLRTNGDGDRNDEGHPRDASSPAHREPVVGWLLILPVLGLLMIAPPALGADAAARSGTTLSGTARASQLDLGYPPLPPGDPARIAVFDYATRAVFDHGESLRDRDVQLTGFVAPGPTGDPVLVRMVLSCCAADAMPVKVGMAGNPPAGLAPDTWIQVVGRYTGRTDTDPVNGAMIPYLDVRTWHEVQPPKQQYE